MKSSCDGNAFFVSLQYAPMESGHWFRRFVHLCTPLFLIYYFLPQPLWTGGLTREQGLLIFFFLAMGFEALRLIFNVHIPGMRDYEYSRLSAAAWAGIGMTLTFLFFPLEYAAPAFLGMGWVDPLIGELRRVDSGLYPHLPAAVYFTIVIATLTCLIGLNLPVVLASITATALGISIEKLRLKHVDDDFLMLIVPLIGITIILEALLV